MTALHGTMLLSTGTASQNSRSENRGMSVKLRTVWGAQRRFSAV